MLHPLNKNKSLKLLLIIGTFLCVQPLQKFSYSNLAIAHEVEVSGDVAVTFHLEPNHNPRAGEKAIIWFALTRRGGKIIPLSECNCQLAIYREPRSPNTQPLMRPQLKAIAAEKYQGIPGTEVIFPQAGIYQLELKGTSKDNNSFKPFKTNYSVTVR
ncbi:conserved exported hypothetical protein [Planktothrix sp. PCC 11201]|uniref:hypothetical protein n=1 Tax=Planktothrix sp. PCC 11201 TaxID=1729650 RepID=UPI0009146A1C|nr:hypothetical protein [Planktothrix sp. PCC 11201]SKB16197.1 conserved exported hypothetical protein [Planktothrix sp. PCC 11201]